MEKARIKITGSHKNGFEYEKDMEFIAEAEIEMQGEWLKLIYDEYLYEDNDYSIKTMLIASEDIIGIVRFEEIEDYSLDLYPGDGEGINLEWKGEDDDVPEGSMIFKAGRRWVDYYHTPVGKLTMEMMTTYVKNSLKPEEGGSIDIEYQVGLREFNQGERRLHIEFLDRNVGES